MSDSSFDCLGGNYYISAASLLLEYRGFIDSHATLSKVNCANPYWSIIAKYCRELEGYPELLRQITKIHLSSQIDFERALFCSWSSLLVSLLLRLPESQQKAIFLAGLLQDVGKYSSTNTINDDNELGSEGLKLRCNNRLGYDEHPLRSAIRAETALPHVEGLSDLILHHHAREDGTGYPMNVGESQLGIDNQILIISNELSDLLDKWGGHNQLIHVLPVLKLNSFLYFDRVHFFWIKLFEPHIAVQVTINDRDSLYDNVKKKVESLEGMLSCLLIISAEFVLYDYDVVVHGMRMMIRRLAYLSTDTGIFDPVLFQQKVYHAKNNDNDVIRDLDSILKGLPEILIRIEMFIDEILNTKKYDVNVSLLQGAKSQLHKNIKNLEGRRCSIFR